MADWVEQLDGLQAGEIAATNRIISLITRYLGRLGAYEMRDDWDDFVQEVLVVLIRKPPQLREPGAIVRHIQTTCYRRYIDEIRRVRGRRRQKDGDEADEAEEGGSGWRRSVPFDEAAEQAASEEADSQIDLGIRAALDRLEERKRRIVAAVYLEGFTYQEASDRLEIPLGTLKGLLRDALRELRTLISDFDERGSSDSSGRSVPHSQPSAGDQPSRDGGRT